VGSGFRIASVAAPTTEGAATLAAVIVTVFGEGIVAGGVYSPVIEIVPVALDPPLMPFTCQVTEELGSLVTVAVICAVEPSRTWAGPLTVTDGVALGVLVLEAHPASPAAKTSKPMPATQELSLPANRSVPRRLMRPSVRSKPETLDNPVLKFQLRARTLLKPEGKYLVAKNLVSFETFRRLLRIASAHPTHIAKPPARV